VLEVNPEQFFVNLFNETAEDGFEVTLGEAQATISIIDSTQPGNAFFTQSEYISAIGASSVDVTLQRVGGSDGELSVDVTTQARSSGAQPPASEGSDFIALSETVPPAVGEPVEAFTVVLSNQVPALSASQGITSANVVIDTDTTDDNPGTPPDDAVEDFNLSIVSGDNQEGMPGDQLDTLVIGVQPNNESADITQVQVRWRSVPATAVAFVDGPTSTPVNNQASTQIRLLEPGFISVIARIEDISSSASAQPVSESQARNNGFRVSAGPGEIVFLVRAGLGARDGLLPNQSATGFALDSACEGLQQLGAGEGSGLTPAQQDLLNTCNALDSSPTNTELAAQLDRLAPEELFYLADAAVESADLQVTNVFNRINSIRSRQARDQFDLSGLNLTIDGQVIPGAVVDAAHNALTGGAASSDSLASPLGFFANGSISVGEVDGRGNQRDADVRTTGLTLGLDYAVADNIVVGAGLGISNNDTDFTGGEGEASLQAINLTAFATYFEADRGYADVVLDIGQNSYEVTRRVNLPSAADQFARGETDALVSSLNLSAGREFQRGAWQFGPYVRMGYTWASIDAYNETATTSAAGFGSVLNVRSHEAKSLTLSLGGQLSGVINTSAAVLVPQARLEYALENEVDKDDIVASFANDPDSTPFTVKGNERDTSHLKLGLGSSFVLRNGRSAYVFYETQLQHDFVSQHWLKFGGRLEF